MGAIKANTTDKDNGGNKKNSLGDTNSPADFETAMSAAGFGRFNIFLLLVACPAAMASVVETAVISYILPSAECDLSLDLLDKGILNAITYCGPDRYYNRLIDRAHYLQQFIIYPYLFYKIGMIVSAIAWGYLSDTKGRKKLLVWGYLADVVCTLCGAMSQSVVQLMIAKFLGGLIMCGPFAVLMSYLTEFHGNSHRARIMMLIGCMFSIASISLPVLALLVLPNEWNFHIFNMTFHSWQVYLAICSIPSLVSGILFIFFPESPRFLMSQGRNAEALEVFKKMYSINKGQPKENYPIKELINENPELKDSDPPDNVSIATIEAAIVVAKYECNNKKSSTNKIVHHHARHPSAFRALFSKPYLSLSLIVYLLNFFILLGQNTMRLWLPQLFASLHEYEQISSKATSMCSILEYSVNKTDLVKNPDDTCIVVITPATYTNNVIVAATGFVGYLVAGSLINALGNKSIQVFGLVIAGTCGIALYWSSSALTTLIISSLYVCLGSISSTSAIGTSVNLFPTSLRTMIVSLSMMIGRMGSITGNVLFPVFMSFGCIPPFVMVGAVMYIGSILSASLPSTKKGNLK